MSLERYKWLVKRQPVGDKLFSTFGKYAPCLNIYGTLLNLGFTDLEIMTLRLWYLSWFKVCSLRWKYKWTNFQIFCSSDILLLNFLDARAEDSIHICPGPQCSLAFKVKLDLRTKEKLQKISLLSISMQSLQSSANISMQFFCKSEINHSTQHPLAFCALGKRSTCSKQRRNSRAISEDLNYVHA